MDVGTAVFRAIADFSGVRKEASKTSSALQGVGDTTKKGFGNKIVKGFTGALGLATKAAGLFGGVIGGTAMVKGWSRLTTIQDSTKRLEVQLGSAAAAGDMMGKVLEVVSGTPFNLDQFADASAVLVGMGVDAQKVPNYLTAIGEASAGMGAAAGDTAARLSKVFGQVTASGKLGSDALNSLAETGVNGLKILANHFGVTTEEMQKMVSSGAVPAEEALDILSKGIIEGSDGIAGATIAMGGTMEGLRDTLTGAVGGWGSALSRFGANVITPFTEHLTVGFQASAKAVDVAGEKIGGAMQKLADSDAGQKFLEWMREIPDLLDKATTEVDNFINSADFQRISTDVMATLSEIWARIYDIGARLWPIVSQVATAFGEAGISLAPILWETAVAAINALLTVVEILLPVLEAVSGFLAEHPQLLAAIIGAFTLYRTAMILTTAASKAFAVAQAAMAAGGVIGRLGKFLTMFTRLRKAYGLTTAAQYALNTAMKANPIGLIIGVISALVAAFIYLWNTNEGFRNFFIGAWNGIVSFFKAAWKNGIKPVLDAIVGFFRDTLPKAFEFLSGVADDVWSAITGFISSAWGKIKGVFDAIVGFLKRILGPVFDWLWKNVIVASWTGIKLIVSGAWKVIKAIFGAIVSFVKNTLGPIFNWLWKNVLSPVWTGISGLIKIAWAIIETIFLAIVWFVSKKLGPMFQWFLDKVIKPVWATIQTVIKTAWAVVKGIFNTIIKFVRGVLSTAFNWFLNNVIKPVWTAIKVAISVAWEIIKGIFNTIIKFVRGVLSAVFTWLLNNIIKPVWTAIKNAISVAWGLIKGIFNTIRDFVRNVLAPVFTWLRDRIKSIWDSIKNTIKNVWNNGIKPVFKALGDFITDKVKPAFQKGVDGIKAIWNTLRNIAAAPINFIIDTVYNNGLRKALNKVRSIVGGDPLPPVDKIPKFAKGGKHGGGWAIVGEEGPELVNFSNPGRVYTADDTQAMLGMADGASDSELRMMNGDSPAQSLLPAGGWIDNIRNGVKKAVDWVRGGLAKTAGFLLNPIKNALTSALPNNAFGDIARQSADSTLAKALSWIAGKDEESMEDGTAIYNGSMGAFHRPSNGPITSPYGPRWGSFHAGVDIAGGGKTFAALNGIVQRVGWNVLGGRTGIGILLNHAKDFWTYYGHNPVGGPQVRPGQEVKAGQHIGYQGATGNVTGTHLHFETHKGRINGLQNPMTYLRDQGGALPPGLSQVMNKTGTWEWVFTRKQVGKLEDMASNLMNAKDLLDPSRLMGAPSSRALATVGAGASGTAPVTLQDSSTNVNIEKLEVNNPAPETASDSLPVALRKAGATGPFKGV